MIGIIIGVLLTIALIRHQAIDSSYLNYGAPIETESDSIIETEINDPYSLYTPLEDRRNKSKYEKWKQGNRDKHRIQSDSYDEYDSNIDTDMEDSDSDKDVNVEDMNVEDILGQIKGIENGVQGTTQSPTTSHTNTHVRTRRHHTNASQPCN